MWFLPTRGRPHLIERMWSLAPPATPGVMAVDEDQVEMYEGVPLPQGWQTVVVARRPLSGKINGLFSRFPSEPWYGLICDDQVPHTPGWDVALVEAAGARKIAWADDGLHHRIGVSVYGGDLMRAVGWLMCPACKHFYTDDVYEMMVRELGVGVPRLDVKVPHWHFSTGKTPYDQTSAERPSLAGDRDAFERWKADEWPRLRDRLKAWLALGQAAEQGVQAVWLEVPC